MIPEHKFRDEDEGVHGRDGDEMERRISSTIIVILLSIYLFVSSSKTWIEMWTLAE
jgi:hypothetical protein